MSKKTGCIKTFVTLTIECSQKIKNDIESVFELESQKIKPFGSRMPEKAFMLTTKGYVKSTNLVEHLEYLLSTYGDKIDNLKRLNREFKINIFVYWESKYGNGGPAIDENLLKSMGDKNIDLFFEFF